MFYMYIGALQMTMMMMMMTLKSGSEATKVIVIDRLGWFPISVL